MAVQNRKQIMTPQGDWVPVEDVPQTPTQSPADPPVRPFLIGELVTLSGRVLEVQSPQGGQTSVKVQLPNGAVWLRGDHVTHAEPLPTGEALAVDLPETPVTEAKKKDA